MKRETFGEMLLDPAALDQRERGLYHRLRAQFLCELLAHGPLHLPRAYLYEKRNRFRGCPPLQLFPAHRAAQLLPVAGSEQGDGPSWCLCHRRAHELYRCQVCL